MMIMEKQSLEVSMLGTSFTIQAPEDRGYLGQLVQHLERTVGHIQRKYNAHEPLKISLLAALNITDELFRCRLAGGTDQAREAGNARAGEDGKSGEIERITERLISTIDRSLTQQE
jgi:cell division protein ZapA (FtsZ GTPase activity inhibitor)